MWDALPSEEMGKYAQFAPTRRVGMPPKGSTSSSHPSLTTIYQLTLSMVYVRENKSLTHFKRIIILHNIFQMSHTNKYETRFHLRLIQK